MRVHGEWPEFGHANGRNADVSDRCDGLCPKTGRDACGARLQRVRRGERAISTPKIATLSHVHGCLHALERVNATKVIRMTWLEHLRSAGRALARPGAQLVLAAAILAIAFPASAAGSIGLAGLCGALGIALMVAWPYAPEWVRTPRPRAASAFVLAVVAVVGIATFRNVLTESPDWQMGDWGPQRAVLAHIMPSLPGLDVPVWNHAVSTGDAPLELYPSLSYLLTGHLAAIFGLEHDLPLALMIVAVVVFLLIALATTAIAMHVAPRPIALVIGLFTLVDSGAVAHGGTVGLFRWALLHSALALAFSTLAALAVLSALRRPRLATSIAIWGASALAVIAHPAGLIAAAASVAALAAVALLAVDHPPRRALAAIFHLLLGVALGAALWMPLAERILAYGQHFPNALRAPARLLEDILIYPSPVTAFAVIEYAGYLGILVALWSRRARPVFVAASAFVLLLGLSDAPYLGLGLAPGLGVARLGTERLAQLARPFVWAAGAYGLAILAGHARAVWRTGAHRHRWVAAALLGLIGAATLRALPAFWGSISDRAANEARVFAPDPLGRRELGRWAEARMREIGPERWARALFEEDTHEHFHLTAETGLPTFHMSPQPDLLLRERIEDTSPASLRRFNVRWVIGIGRSPSLGDPATEKTFGSYRVREVSDWDGKLARIERGTGEVVVKRLDDRAVEVEVTGTREPVLVALGMGFYPRWRARHASGADEPVYAYPTVVGGKLHVVAAWLAPGRTTFTCDGPLPSDHAGRGVSLLALLAAAACVAIWTRARWRGRVLRWVGRHRARGAVVVRWAMRVGVPLAFVALLVRGWRDGAGPTRALQLGSGLRSVATVEARKIGDSAWELCDYSRISGDYHCDGLLTAYDATTTLINDAAPSWPFVTPALAASADTVGVEMRVRVRARLDGLYHVAVSEGMAELSVEGEASRELDNVQLHYVDRGERVVELHSKVPMTAWTFTMVRDDTVVPPRPFLAGPPEEASAPVRAIAPP